MTFVTYRCPFVCFSVCVFVFFSNINYDILCRLVIVKRELYENDSMHTERSRVHFLSFALINSL